MSKSRILSVANMYFNAIRENKILAKISESPVMDPPARRHLNFAGPIEYCIN